PGGERHAAERRRTRPRARGRRAAARADRARARRRGRLVPDRRDDHRHLPTSAATDLPRVGVPAAAFAADPRGDRVRALPAAGSRYVMTLRAKLTLMFLGALQVTFFTAIGTFWAVQSWQLVADDLTMIHEQNVHLEAALDGRHRTRHLRALRRHAQTLE